MSSTINISDMDNSTDVANITSLELPPAATLTLGCFELIFAISGVLGNALTITTLSRERKLRADVASWFIINLAVADSLVCIFMMLNDSLKFLLEVDIERHICKAYPIIRYSLINTTVLSMLGVTINRYILICQHAWYARVYTRENLICMTLLIWIIPFMVMLLPAFEIVGKAGYVPERKSCLIVGRVKGEQSPLFAILMSFFSVTCIAIIVSYTLIFMKVRESRLSVENHRSDAVKGSLKRAKIGRSEMYLTNMIGVILISYIIAFIPIGIVRHWDSVAEQSGAGKTHPAIYVTSLLFGASIYCTNFFIYAATNRQYREAYKRLICWKRQNDTRDSTSGRDTLKGQVV